MSSAVEGQGPVTIVPVDSQATDVTLYMHATDSGVVLAQQEAGVQCCLAFVDGFFWLDNHGSSITPSDLNGNATPNWETKSHRMGRLPAGYEGGAWQFSRAPIVRGALCEASRLADCSQNNVCAVARLDARLCEGCTVALEQVWTPDAEEDENFAPVAVYDGANHVLITLPRTVAGYTDARNGTLVLTLTVQCGSLLATHVLNYTVVNYAPVFEHLPLNQSVYNFSQTAFAGNFPNTTLIQPGFSSETALIDIDCAGTIHMVWAPDFVGSGTFPFPIELMRVYHAVWREGEALIDHASVKTVFENPAGGDGQGQSVRSLFARSETQWAAAGTYVNIDVAFTSVWAYSNEHGLYNDLGAADNDRDNPVVVIDHYGNVHLVYTRGDPGGASARRDLVYCCNFGVLFVLDVNEPAANTSLRVNTMTVDADGILYVLWFNNPQSQGNAFGDWKLGISFDGGAQWQTINLTQQHGVDNTLTPASTGMPAGGEGTLNTIAGGYIFVNWAVANQNVIGGFWWSSDYGTTWNYHDDFPFPGFLPGTYRPAVYQYPCKRESNRHRAIIRTHAAATLPNGPYDSLAQILPDGAGGVSVVVAPRFFDLSQTGLLQWLTHEQDDDGTIIAAQYDQSSSGGVDFEDITRYARTMRPLCTDNDLGPLDIENACVNILAPCTIAGGALSVYTALAPLVVDNDEVTRVAPLLGYDGTLYARYLTQEGDHLDEHLAQHGLSDSEWTQALIRNNSAGAAETPNINKGDYAFDSRATTWAVAGVYESDTTPRLAYVQLKDGAALEFDFESVAADASPQSIATAFDYDHNLYSAVVVTFPLAPGGLFVSFNGATPGQVDLSAADPAHTPLAAKIGADASGNVLCVYTHAPAGAGGELAHAVRTTDAGASWSAPLPLPITGEALDMTRSEFVMTRQGVGVFAYFQGTGSAHDIAYTVTTDNGESWSAPRILYSGTNAGQLPRARVNQDRCGCRVLVLADLAAELDVLRPDGAGGYQTLEQNTDIEDADNGALGSRYNAIPLLSGAIVIVHETTGGAYYRATRADVLS